MTPSATAATGASHGQRRTFSAAIGMARPNSAANRAAQPPGSARSGVAPDRVQGVRLDLRAGHDLRARPRGGVHVLLVGVGQADHHHLPAQARRGHAAGEEVGEAYGVTVPGGPG